jgi:hypothetical protein
MAAGAVHGSRHITWSHIEVWQQYTSQLTQVCHSFVKSRSMPTPKLHSFAGLWRQLLACRADCFGAHCWADTLSLSVNSYLSAAWLVSTAVSFGVLPSCVHAQSQAHSAAAQPPAVLGMCV